MRLTDGVCAAQCYHMALVEFWHSALGFAFYRLIQTGRSVLAESKERKKERDRRRLQLEAQQKAEEAERQREQELLRQQKQEMQRNYRDWLKASDRELTRRAIQRSKDWTD